MKQEVRVGHPPTVTSRFDFMKLGETLFRTDQKIFEVVDESFLDTDYLNWKLVPLAGQNLAKEYTLSGLTDGYFILEGLLVHADGRVEKAYTDIGLPERLIDYHFLLRNDEIVRGRGTLILNAQVIPAVAIEKFGDPDQYYVKGHAEVGLKILREGLAVAKLKWPIALDLAYILRDENRPAEAIEAFTLAISQCDMKSYLFYAERAELFAKMNDQEAAGRDWIQVEQMAGASVLKNLRGF